MPATLALTAASTVALGLAVTLIGIVGWGVATYHRLVALRQRAFTAFAAIDPQLQRRHALIPRLVQLAQDQLRHVSQTLESLVAARAAAVETQGRTTLDGPAQPAAQLASLRAETRLTVALQQIVTIIEGYPDLKSSQAMAALMEELRTTENRIAFARQAANDAVTAYNRQLQIFPVSFLARPLGFTSAEHLEIERAAERELPAAMQAEVRRT